MYVSELHTTWPIKQAEGGYVSHRKACSFVSTRVKGELVNNTHKCLSLDLTVTLKERFSIFQI
jgi:hypothetical protein